MPKKKAKTQSKGNKQKQIAQSKSGVKGGGYGEVPEGRSSPGGKKRK
jgi:hypothetical protein